MRYLGLALFAEGPTDHAFLRPLLRRLCEHLCLALGKEPMEISEVLELHSLVKAKEADRATRIQKAAERSEGAWTVLFIHADGSGDADTARRTQIEPGCELIANIIKVSTGRTVAVVPVRETEAWSIADGDALRIVFGSKKSNAELGVPTRPQDVEAVLDPKQTLRAAYNTVLGWRRGRRRRKVSSMLEPLGEQVSFDVLARVPAFLRLQQDLVEALSFLGYIQRDAQ